MKKMKSGESAQDFEYIGAGRLVPVDSVPVIWIPPIWSQATGSMDGSRDKMSTVRLCSLKIK